MKKRLRQTLAKSVLCGMIIVVILGFLIPTCHYEPQELQHLCIEQEEYLLQKIEQVGDSIFTILDSLFERMREMFNNQQ